MTDAEKRKESLRQALESVGGKESPVGSGWYSVSTEELAKKYDTIDIYFNGQQGDVILHKRR